MAKRLAITRIMLETRCRVQHVYATATVCAPYGTLECIVVIWGIEMMPDRLPMWPDYLENAREAEDNGQALIRGQNPQRLPPMKLFGIGINTL